MHVVSQATALCWHPDRRQLVAGWENGELNAWYAGQRTFISIGGTHKSPIVSICFSEQGGRMITADSVKLTNLEFRFNRVNSNFDNEYFY